MRAEPELTCNAMRCGALPLRPDRFLRRKGETRGSSVVEQVDACMCASATVAEFDSGPLVL